MKVRITYANGVSSEEYRPLTVRLSYIASVVDRVDVESIEILSVEG